jgi:hypothetical protein
MSLPPLYATTNGSIFNEEGSSFEVNLNTVIIERLSRLQHKMTNGREKKLLL